ncbi:hypothetical protein GCM10011351_09490 [Paraliobacillus quinghaiensis]|uniref:Uncharacterized protein n=1 Tax=Paraliobacillus quinghaiensis TaxID=470815 RepID=A0A917TK08_9BACI|nr:hypothetical protein [Paraliobacillus quinghaiensis]GGM25957.1 hypothetical protein GCM10011351_09490 [Paraliobacillus quinghaiensis]
MKPVICPYCQKPIEKRDQLVTVSNMFRIRPYHYVCYQTVERETRTIWSFWTPVNGVAGNIRFVFLLGIAIWFLTTDSLGMGGELVGVIAFYNVMIHLTAYFLYERRVPK